MKRWLFWLLLAPCLHAGALPHEVHNTSGISAHAVPEEFASRRFEVIVNGQPVPVFHAVLNLYFASFDARGAADVEVRSPTADYWQGQAIIRPLSRGVVPVTNGAMCRFTVKAPGQFSVERPGTHGFKDEVLFVFANAPETNPIPRSGPNTIVLGPGIHQRNIDLTSHQTLYLASGAVLFGGINVWNATDVHIAGPGTVVYYGPQALGFDTGWMHRRSWHPLTTHQVKRLSISGVTFVNRSRTWSIQLWQTTDSTIENVKIIAASEGNINQDGIDFYGGGHNVVRDSFLRTADDSFALLNHTSLPVFHTGQSTGEVVDLTIERCVLWPTLANVFRLGWVGQSLTTRNITFRDSDIIHFTGGEWQAPYGLIHAASVKMPGQSHHSHYLLQNLRFEEPAALFGINYDSATLSDFTLRNVSIAGPAVSSLVRNSELNGITFDHVTLDGKTLGSKSDFPLRLDNAKIENLRFIADPKRTGRLGGKFRGEVWQPAIFQSLTWGRLAACGGLTGRQMRHQTNEKLSGLAATGESVVHAFHRK